MGSTWTIFKREIKVYFTSPIAYVLAVIFLAITGYLFTGNVLTYSLASIQAARNPYIEGVNPVDMVLMPLFGNIGFVLLFLLPVLTMRLFAEEKKSGTSELLFCYPVRDIEILAGKYLAALFVTSLMIGLTGLFLLLLWVFGMAEPGVAFSGYLGMFLLAATFLACGIFISSLTENQIVAAVLTLGVLLLLWLVGWSAAKVGPTLSKVFEYISLVQHLINFARGVIDTSDIVYYLCLIFFFLFLTLRSMESRRWRG